MKKIMFTLLGACALVATSSAQTALNFDGGDDVVVIGNGMTTDLTGATTFTVEAWVNSTSTNGLGVIVGNYNYPANNNSMQFMLRKDNDQYIFWLNDGNGYQSIPSTSGSVIPGQWQHIAGTWDGSVARIYVDGVENAQNVMLTGPGFPSITNEVVIGNNAFGEPFLGSIDNVRIWNVNRTAAEIAAGMNCEVVASSAGLLAMYHFNDGLDSGVNTSNTLLFDNSGNGYHGTLQNFALNGTASNFVTSNRSDYMSIQSAIGSSASADRMLGFQPADFNGDGFDDLLVSTEAGARSIYYSDGHGRFELPTPIANTVGGSFAVGDVDNDGDIDFINYFPFSPTSIQVYVNDGSGNFTEQTPFTMNATGSIGVMEIADINGDGLADIIMGNSGMAATDLNEVWLNNGTIGNPSFVYGYGLNSTYAQVNGIAIGDIDGDNDVDLAFGGSSWGAVVFINDNNTGFTEGQSIPGYAGAPRFIDWNQDGHLDFVNNDSYNNWGVRVRYNNGSGSFDANSTIIVPGANNLLSQVAFADMNDDGFLDIASRHWGGNGMLYISNGCVLTQQTACAYKLGPADNNVMIGDFNGDGKPDVFCGARDRKSSVSLNFMTPVTTPALADIVSATGDEVCVGEQISVEATADNPSTILWFSNAAGTTQIGSGSPFSPTAGAGNYQYYVAAQNANGCRSLIDTVEVIVNENPTASVNTAASITELACFGDANGALNVDVTLNGTATTATYLWDDAAGSTSQNLTGVGVGNYTLILTDDNGCTATTSGTITQPDELVGATAVTDVTCNGGTDGAISLSVAGGTATYSFEWDDATSSATQDLTGIGAGVYIVTITDANGCNATTSGVVDEPTAITATDVSVGETAAGNDGTIDLTVSGGTAPYVYAWIGPNGFTSTDQNLTGLVGGTYEVTVTDMNGCSFTYEVILGSTVGLNENGLIQVSLYPNPSNGVFTIITPVNTALDILNTNGQVMYSRSLEQGSTQLDVSNLAKGVYTVRLTTEYGMDIKQLVLN